jgi:hypothetical protein
LWALAVVLALLVGGGSYLLKSSLDETRTLVQGEMKKEIERQLSQPNIGILVREVAKDKLAEQLIPEIRNAVTEQVRQRQSEINAEFAKLRPRTVTESQRRAIQAFVTAHPQTNASLALTFIVYSEDSERAVYAEQLAKAFGAGGGKTEYTIDHLHGAEEFSGIRVCASPLIDERNLGPARLVEEAFRTAGIPASFVHSDVCQTQTFEVVVGSR